MKTEQDKADEKVVCSFFDALERTLKNRRLSLSAVADYEGKLLYISIDNAEGLPLRKWEFSE